MILGIYEKAINKKFNWEEKILIAKKAGFDYIELSIDESDEKLKRLDWTKEEIENILQLLSKHNMYFNSMCLSGHRKYPFGSIDINIRKQANEIMQKAIILANKLNIHIIQLAGYDVYYEPSSDITVDNFINGLFKAVYLASKYCVMLAFEIMDTSFMGTIDKAMKYVNIIGSPWLQIYPDLGNLSQFSTNPEKEIIDNKKNIVAFHIKDATKTQMRDFKLGEGNVDFISLFKSILSFNFNGPFTIEMWSLNDKNETIEQAINEIAIAKKFVLYKLKIAECKNVRGN